MRSRKGSPTRPENKLLVSKVCSLYFLGFTHEEIANALGLSMNVVHRYCRQRSLLDPLKLDPRAQQARALKLTQLEDDIAKNMPGALAGDLCQAWAATRAIKRRCHLLGFFLAPKR
jgi:hypothetical protein